MHCFNRQDTISKLEKRTERHNQIICFVASDLNILLYINVISNVDALVLCSSCLFFVL